MHALHPLTAIGLCNLALSIHVAAEFDSDPQHVMSSADSRPTELGTGKPKGKNIVFILSDDQDLTMDSVSYMPLLKSHIVDKGASFDNHFTTTAICCPSRVALWTGKQPHNTNVTDVSPPYGGYPKFISQGLNENYLPVWLQEAGYQTYYTGKLFNAHTIYNYDSPHVAGWTSSDFLLDPGTYSYLNPIYQKNHDQPVRHQGSHTSDLISEKASGLLREAIASEEPFFLAVAPIAPHSNIDANTGGPPQMNQPIPLERHAELFKSTKVPRTKNFNPEEASGVSWINKLARINETGVSYLDKFYQARLQALQGVDELVERLVDELEAAGILNETYIIYTADNGYHLGQHRLPPGKECGFEEDIRVPFVIRGPGIPAGTVESAVTTHIDLAPTLLRLAGIELRSDFDGTPIPLPSDEPGTVIRHEHVGVEYWGTAIAEGTLGGFDGNGQIVMKNNTYKAIRLIGEGYNIYYSVWCNNEHEFYDIENDPDQMVNLYSEGRPSKTFFLGRDLTIVIDRLDALQMVMKSCRGETCVKPWKVLHPDGGVESLVDALNHTYDAFYEDQLKVSFDRCAGGYIIDAEGPQHGYSYRNGGSWHMWT
ncbi:hypothetical protein SCAR479_04226 [Seiridium cardinale]|uniref:Arylsulfatase n=1 Tax=Seiridium cardinale TaxID=138064 RepID=A0ABR2XZJ8_9PEZI